MKKRIILFSLLCFLVFGIKAQTTVKFNKTYTFIPGVPACLTYSIMSSNDGYVIYGETNDSNNNSRIAIIKIDTIGNQLWSKSYGKEGFQYNATDEEGGGGGGLSVPWGGYVGTGWVTNDSGTWSDAVLFRFNSKGDTLWTRKYKDSAQIECTALKITRDKKYIIGGMWIGPSNFYTVTLMKTDSLGNKLWQKNYNTGLACIIGGIDTCKDGGFILTADEDYALTANNIYIIKTDSLGNVKWTQVLSDSISGCSVNGWGIIALKNGEYELCGNYEYNSNPGYSNFYLCRLSTIGSVKWAKKYIYSSGWDGGFFMLRELPNGDIITSGDGTDNSSNLLGVIMKVDSNGNKIWLRSYSASVSQDALNDIRPTPDGGCVACGFTYGLTENIWVVKVDSLGCDTTDCDFLGVSEVTMDNAQFNLYPNPANSQLTIAYQLVPGSTDANIIIYHY